MGFDGVGDDDDVKCAHTKAFFRGDANSVEEKKASK